MANNKANNAAKDKQVKKNTQQTGISGEFLALSKLIEHGFIAAPTLKNTPNIDILVSDGVTARMAQVKPPGPLVSALFCNKDFFGA
jgi:hypothetical protein